MPLGHIFESEGPTTLWLPPSPLNPSLNPYRTACGSYQLPCEISYVSKMAGISTDYPLKSPYTEWSWMTLHRLMEKCTQAALCILMN